MESFGDRGLNLEDGTAAGGAERKREVVEVGVDVNVGRKFERQLLGFGEYRDRKNLKLDIAVLFVLLDIFLGTLVDLAADFHDPFGSELGADRMSFLCVREDDPLDFAAYVPEFEEDELALVAAHVDPATDSGFRADF